jgi:hypothetical protein
MKLRGFKMAFIDSGKTFDTKENHRKLSGRVENREVSSYLLRIPPKLHHQVKIKLSKEKKNMKEILIEMLEKYINDK